LSFEKLNEDVIESGLCTGCGACAYVCPTNAISITKKPRLTGRCEGCGTCIESCYIFKGETSNSLDRLKIFAAYSKIEEAKKKGQDGGVVTTILTSLLNKDMIDCAAVVVGNNKDRPNVNLARSIEEIFEASGTKYGTAPIISVLDELDKNERVAMVGTPCQIKALRSLMKNNSKYRESIKYLIGLFCMKNFDFNRLFKGKISGEDIKLEDIEKCDIDKGVFQVFLINGKKIEFNLNELKGCVRNSCNYCSDFEAELADISVGSVASEGGYSTIIIRSSNGLEAFDVSKESLNFVSLNQEDISIVDKLTSLKKDDNV